LAVLNRDRQIWIGRGAGRLDMRSVAHPFTIVIAFSFVSWLASEDWDCRGNYFLKFFKIIFFLF
jgi:hypothetical protein